MTNQDEVQRLPSTWGEREALREKGQFWTPPWIADAMVSYGVREGCVEVFDPAVGAGAFFRAAKRLESVIGRRFVLSGTEIDPSALQEALATGLTAEDLLRVEITDFVLAPPRRMFEFIVANPPYIRHHRLGASIKTTLKRIYRELTSFGIDGRAGFHIYFLVRALSLLRQDGKLAFIVPADTVEGVFADSLWKWITKHYRLNSVVTFEANASPFPRVDTNPIILMLQRSEPKEYFWWARCLRSETPDLFNWVLSDFGEFASPNLLVRRRTIPEGLRTGLSREAASVSHEKMPTLGHYATALRGIATGDNSFFLMTQAKAKSLALSDEFLLRAVSRTRDVSGEVLTPTDLDELEREGRPTVLFSPDGRPLHLFPESVQAYLRKGEAMGLDKGALIGQRRPWYKMESRVVPPFLFAYLGRRNTRFIKNDANVVPLTGFLCVYPRRTDDTFVGRLWEVLRHPDTIANLVLVGKSYGQGAIKVEPRALERLPIPMAVLKMAGLEQPSIPKQSLPISDE